MICARCHHAILPGEDYDVIDKLSGSGGGTTLHVHKQPCPRPEVGAG
ncbi:hypothetical protein [Streptomyces sp. NPDC018833]